MDHIILADDTYYSLDENKYMTLIHENNKYKTYEVLKPRLDEEKKEYGKLKEEEGFSQGEKIGISKRNVEIAREMLSNNEDISKILKYTELSKKDIEKIKSDMSK